MSKRRRHNLGRNTTESVSEPLLGRRAFLALSGTAVVATAATLAIRSLMSDPEGVEGDESQRFFNAFPESLPGVSKGGVEKFPTEGAKHCLIHIRDVHGLASVYDDMFLSMSSISKLPLRMQIAAYHRFCGGSFDELDWTWLTDDLKQFIETLLSAPAMQKFMSLRAEMDEPVESEENINTAKAVAYIARELGVKEIHIEGVASQDMELMDNHRDIMELSEKNIQNLKLLASSDPRLHESLWEAQASHYSFARLHEGKLNALVPLHHNGTIRVMPTSNDENLEREVKAIHAHVGKRTLTDDEKKVVSEKREKEILRIGSSKKVMLLRFGGAHKFEERIKQWNDEHPDERYSLIVLTPDGYEDPLASQHSQKSSRIINK